ncbi:GNAT family N-acetyltransferase [Lysobacter olei]
MISFREVLPHDTALIADLCLLLQDSVARGASVGFLHPVRLHSAAEYWHGVMRTLGPAQRMWVAQHGTRAVGSVQLALCERENGRHRAEVQKLLVLGGYRRQGIGSRLLDLVDACAEAEARTLLVLDTEAGSEAEQLYQARGWVRAGAIPGYARGPQGAMAPTALYFRCTQPLG